MFLSVWVEAKEWWYFKVPALIEIPSVQTRQWQLSGSRRHSDEPTPPRLSALIPPNVISKMLEKFIALETQPRTPWLLLRGRVNAEGAPLAKHCCYMPVTHTPRNTH